MSWTKHKTQQAEDANLHTAGIEGLAPRDALNAMYEGQLAAAAVVTSSIPQIAEASANAASCLSSGGKLAYIGAGSSGLIAITDGFELPGTFGIDPQQIKLILAGGHQTGMTLNSVSEDDADLAIKDIADADLGKGDCAILVSASGSTPYTLGAMKALHEAGALTIAVANNEVAPLFEQADVVIRLLTPPEVLAGSTRMGAGTAQKIALNMFSTLVGIHLGHVHAGLMVNVVADNEKLRQRAIGIVVKIAKCSTAEAQKFVERSGGNVKLATLLAKGAGSIEDAESLLAEHNGKLRNCFKALAQSQAKPTAR